MQKKITESIVSKKKSCYTVSMNTENNPSTQDESPIIELYRGIW